MNRLGRTQAYPWWLAMQLWGLDAPVAAFFWGLAYASLMDIPMITSGPLLLLTAGVWLAALSSRLYRAVALNKGWYVPFYRVHFAPVLMLTLAVAAATIWMFFFYVGQLFLIYAYKPLLYTAVGFLPFVNRREAVRGVFHAVAVAWACALPAAFYSVTVSPHELWFFAPTCYLATLVFLYYLVRGSWQMEEEDARKRGLFVTLALVPLFFFCLLSAATAPAYERSLCLSIAIGAACLELLIRLRPHLSQDALVALGWLSLGLPPVLGMLIFT